MFDTWNNLGIYKEIPGLTKREARGKKLEVRNNKIQKRNRKSDRQHKKQKQ